MAGFLAVLSILVSAVVALGIKVADPVILRITWQSSGRS
jgi:hypothetical protein